MEHALTVALKNIQERPREKASRSFVRYEQLQRYGAAWKDSMDLYYGPTDGLSLGGDQPDGHANVRSYAIGHHDEICRDPQVIRIYTDGSNNFGYVAAAATIPYLGKVATDVLGPNPSRPTWPHPNWEPNGEDKTWTVASAELHGVLLGIELAAENIPESQPVALFLDWQRLFRPSMWSGNLQVTHMRRVLDRLLAAREILSKRNIEVNLAWVPDDIGGLHTAVHDAAYEAAFPLVAKDELRIGRMQDFVDFNYAESEDETLPWTVRQACKNLATLQEWFLENSTTITPEDMGEWKYAMRMALEEREFSMEKIKRREWSGHQAQSRSMPVPGRAMPVSDVVEQMIYLDDKAGKEDIEDFPMFDPSSPAFPLERIGDLVQPEPEILPPRTLRLKFRSYTTTPKSRLLKAIIRARSKFPLAKIGKMQYPDPVKAPSASLDESTELPKPVRTPFDSKLFREALARAGKKFPKSQIGRFGSSGSDDSRS